MVVLELTKRTTHPTKMIARRVYIHLHCDFALQLMYTGRNYIATMDFRLSLSPLPSQSPEHLLAEAPSPPTSMPLPPEATYSSKEELYRAIQAFTAQHHDAFTIGRSTKINNGVRTRILYNCDRYGLPPPANHPQRNLQARKRQTTTRKTNCQFSIIAVKCSNTQWELRYKPSI